jgi:anti-sigma-K factor RskA
MRNEIKKKIRRRFQEVHGNRPPEGFVKLVAKVYTAERSKAKLVKFDEAREKARVSRLKSRRKK